MFSLENKQKIAEKIQKILQDTNDTELPEGEINFLLHVDGAEDWSWANIKNNGAKRYVVPTQLIGNGSV